MRHRRHALAAVIGLASLPACAPLAAATGPVAPSGPASALLDGLAVPRWAMLLAILAIGLGLTALLWIGMGGHRRAREGVPARLSSYTVADPGSPAPAASGRSGPSSIAASAVELTDRLVRRRRFDEALALRLDAAGLPLRPAEWVLLHVGSAVGLGLTLMLLTGFRLLPTLIGIGAGVAAPFAYLRVKRSRRRRAFGDRLADTLQLMSGSLSAGYSLPQSVDTVVREGVDPVSSEFNRALMESRLGVPIEDALDTVAERMDSQDLHWVVMATRVQRQVGGNLSELLSTVSATLRERAQLRRQVQVLSAEGRMSAWILTLLPIAFGLYLLLARPEYLAPLVTDVIGWVMLAVAALLLLVGGLWMRKIVDVEV